MFTSFYMFRLMFLTFWGKFRGTNDQEHHLHESPSSMTIPLIILAVLSTVGGFIGLPESLGGHNWLGTWLNPLLSPETSVNGGVPSEMLLMGISVSVAVLALVYAYIKYIKNAQVPVEDTEERSFGANLSYHKFYIDELYDAIIRKPLDALSGFLYNVVERLGIDGIVESIGKGPIEASKGLRLLQTGNVGFYIFMMVVGIIAVLVYSFVRI